MIVRPDKHWGLNSSRKMNKCFTLSSVHDSRSHFQCDQMSKNVSDANHVILRAQNRDSLNKQGRGYKQESRFSTASTSSVAPRSHQRRWSVDICKCGTSSVIIVRKNKKEPQPPLRSVSLQPDTGDRCLFKRYSCPPIGVFSSPRHSL